MTDFKKHEPCPQCGSRDALARYKDGHGYCFKCEHYEPASNTLTEKSPQRSSPDSGSKGASKKPAVWAQGEHKALPKRNLNVETCQKWDYQVGDVGGKLAHIANYRNQNGALIGQKLRYADKTFCYKGQTPAPLFGLHLWNGGKRVVVVEGEIDALSVSQASSHKLPVVSVPNGAQSAYKSLQQHLAWFDGFETVILLFDQDEPGIKAAYQCAELFKPGKVHIAKLPLKDANEMLAAKRERELCDAIYKAPIYRPDGIIEGVETWPLIEKPPQNSWGISYPFYELTQKTKGIRQGEIVTFCAGTGIGKSQVCREIAYHLIKGGFKVGYIALEENVLHSVRALMGLELFLPLHQMSGKVSLERLKKAWDKIAPYTAFYDHFGSLEPHHLFNRIRCMAAGLECIYIILDHISIVVSGISEGDERRLIDNVMTQLRSLVEELQIALILITHLKRPDGKGHEEGAQTSLSQLRGSAAIAQLSDMVIGLERDQQGNQPHTMRVRILKNRFTGETGLAGELEYELTTGRLWETSLKEFTLSQEKG
jgi:twinkle protein